MAPGGFLSLARVMVVLNIKPPLSRPKLSIQKRSERYEHNKRTAYPITPSSNPNSPLMMAPMQGDDAVYEIPESLTTSFSHPQSSRESSPPTVEQLLSQYGRPCPPRSVDCEPGLSPENPINVDDIYQKRDTQLLSEDQEASLLGGDTEHESDSETVDGRNTKATSAWDLERGSQAQPQLGPHPIGPAQPEAEVVDATERSLASAGSDKKSVRTLSPRTTPTELTDNISGDRSLKDTHATDGDSFARRFEPDTSGRHILLHRAAADGRLEFLLWSPIWFSEDAVAKIAPDQLNLYKKKLDTELASGASQARKRARSPSPKPRRSLRQKKPRQC
ncbi:hypothetical protein ACJ73_00068 [Blastomyces percursus]|uniref:Uncharacterized protein n=1 Tax=Blastomyces percursus TaxID=1658174 RepID=A0A1J9RLS0_9EURO|nr:hypothetical protein ACJ73_00068 [Blastomyces percursus]